MSVDSRSSSFIFLISWILYLLQFTLVCFAEKPCRLDKPFPKICGENSTCEQTTGSNGTCKCLQTHVLNGEKCVLIPVPSASSSSSTNEHDLISNGSSVALWILIPCFILILTGVAFFLAKRLKLIEKLYQFRVRRYNTVFVTSLQDDDAPIT